MRIGSNEVICARSSSSLLAKASGLSVGVLPATVVGAHWKIDSTVVDGLSAVSDLRTTQHPYI